MRAIASAVGINKETVSRDLQVSGNQTPEIQGADGKTYTVTCEPEPEVVDAELVDEPVRPEPSKVKRRPLPEAFTDAGRAGS